MKKTTLFLTLCMCSGLFADAAETVTPKHDAVEKIAQQNNVQDDIQKIMTNMQLSQQDCDVIISFLKQAKEDQELWDGFTSSLTFLLKEGLLLYTSFLTGMFVLTMWKQDVHSFVSRPVEAVVYSGASTLLSYALMKVLDQKILRKKDEQETIKALLDMVREIRESLA